MFGAINSGLVSFNLTKLLSAGCHRFVNDLGLWV